MTTTTNCAEPGTAAIPTGAGVTANIRHGINVAGEVLYCGPIEGKLGDFVGLRLSPEFHQHGKNDGSVTG